MHPRNPGPWGRNLEISLTEKEVKEIKTTELGHGWLTSRILLPKGWGSNTRKGEEKRAYFKFNFRLKIHDIHGFGCSGQELTIVWHVGIRYGCSRAHRSRKHSEQE